MTKSFISDIYSGYFCLVFIGFCAICAYFLASVGTGRLFFCLCWFVSRFESYSYMVFKSSDCINVKDLTKTKLNGLDSFLMFFFKDC